VRVMTRVYNPDTGEIFSVSNVIYETETGGGGGGEGSEQEGSSSSSTKPKTDRAYWIGRKLKKAIYGCVRACKVLKLHKEEDSEGGDREGGGGGGGNSQAAATWEVTKEEAAVKVMDWKKVLQLRGRHSEDPMKEIAAMQFLTSHGGSHPHVVGARDVMRDRKHLYLFMPFCSCGELFDLVKRDGRFEEETARYYFRQLLSGLAHLQKLGVCHRDVSLENILVDRHAKSLVIDMGMCLRVPFSSSEEDGSASDVSDASSGTLRRLMTPQGQCGKPNYISPEVLDNEAPFDGFAIDLWAAGIVLFVMLVGLPPFDWAGPDDARYRMVMKGKLAHMLNKWERPIPADAMDLLARMMREDPADRLCLREVMEHPWVTEGEVRSLPCPKDPWRK